MPDAVAATPSQPVAPAATPAPDAALVTPPAEVAPPAASAESAKPEAQEPDRFGPRFAALARQEKALATEKRRLSEERKAAEQSAKAREDAIAARAAKAEEIEKRLAAAKADPDGFLRGIYGENYYDQLTEMRLSGKTSTPDLAVQAVRDEAKAEIERIRKEQEDRWAKVEEERRAAQEAARAQAEAQQRAAQEEFEAETVAVVKAAPERFELIAMTDSFAMVPQVIRDVFERTSVRDESGKMVKPGRIMTAEEAAEHVEKHLEEQASRVFGGKKWQARLAAERAAAEKKPAPAAETPKTLTNGMTAAAPSLPGTRSADDRIQRAVEAMRAVQAQAKAAQGA